MAPVVDSVPCGPLAQPIREWLDRQTAADVTHPIENLAAAARVSARRVSAILHGEQDRCAFDTYDRIATAIDRDELLELALAHAPANPRAALSRPPRIGPSRYRHRRDAKLTSGQLAAAYRLHIDGGLSLREIARRGWDAWGYSGPHAASVALSEQLRRAGMKPRDRVAATVAVSTVHGKHKDPQHRHKLRVARGEIRGVRCAAVKDRPGKGNGEPCRVAALAGEIYCAAHHPDRAAERAARLADARRRTAREQRRRAAA